MRIKIYIALILFIYYVINMNKKICAKKSMPRLYNKKILEHYLKFSTYTNPGCYKDLLKKLPDDVRKIGNLVAKQIIHSLTLRNGNMFSNSDLRYGDMNRIPWWRLRCEDDILPTASAMIAELVRLDKKGFTLKRKTEDKIIVTCRFAAVLMSSILKTKGIPSRVRSGFAPYFRKGSWDHWINQYWNGKRWVAIDVDAALEDIDFDVFDMPKDKFDWAADSWIGIREGRLDENNFIHGGLFKGKMPVAWAVFYDFHCLMNNEILYLQQPNFIYGKFDKLKEKELKEIDALARLLKEPDKNFFKLKKIWDAKKKFRVLSGGLISENDHVKYK